VHYLPYPLPGRRAQAARLGLTRRAASGLAAASRGYGRLAVSATLSCRQLRSGCGRRSGDRARRKALLCANDQYSRSPVITEFSELAHAARLRRWG
jgi:hypothetical protein